MEFQDKPTSFQNFLDVSEITPNILKDITDCITDYFIRRSFKRRTLLTLITNDNRPFVFPFKNTINYSQIKYRTMLIEVFLVGFYFQCPTFCQSIGVWHRYCKRAFSLSFPRLSPPLHPHSLTLKTTRSRVSPVRIGSVLHMINKSRLCRRKTFTDFRTQREHIANKLAKIMSLLVRRQINKMIELLLILVCFVLFLLR